MSIEALYLKAKECLDRGDSKTARDLGHQLLKKRFSGAFEILAKSFHLEGQTQIAVTVLENGVKEAPQIWSLWLQLGNYKAELRDLESAVSAYQRARQLAPTESDQIDLNEALLRSDFGNKNKALELFAKVIKNTEDRGLRLVALKHRLSTLIELGQVTEALMELGEAYQHDSDNAELLTHLSFVLFEQGDQGNALNLAMQALGLKRSGAAARIVRLIQGEESEACSLFDVTLSGHFPEDNLDFEKRSKVYAESEEEAGRLAIDFEPADVRHDLKVKEVKEIATPVSERKGVDWSGDLEPV